MFHTHRKQMAELLFCIPWSSLSLWCGASSDCRWRRWPPSREV